MMETKSVSETLRFCNWNKAMDVLERAESCLERYQFINCSKFSRISWRSKKLYHLYVILPCPEPDESIPLLPIFFCLKIIFNIILFWSLCVLNCPLFPSKLCINLFYSILVAPPVRLLFLWYERTNDILRGAKTRKLLLVQLASLYYEFLWFRSRCSPQHHILKRPQSMLSP
jgi:hypothetical protein